MDGFYWHFGEIFGGFGDGGKIMEIAAKDGDCAGFLFGDVP